MVSSGTSSDTSVSHKVGSFRGIHCAFSIVPCFMSVSSFVQIGIAKPEVLLPLVRIGRDGTLALHCTWQSTAEVVRVHYRVLPQMNMKYPTW